MTVEVIEESTDNPEVWKAVHIKITDHGDTRDYIELVSPYGRHRVTLPINDFNAMMEWNLTKEIENAITPR